MLLTTSVFELCQFPQTTSFLQQLLHQTSVVHLVVILQGQDFSLIEMTSDIRITFDYDDVVKNRV